MNLIIYGTDPDVLGATNAAWIICTSFASICIVWMAIIGLSFYQYKQFYNADINALANDSIEKKWAGSIVVNDSLEHKHSQSYKKSASSKYMNPRIDKIANVDEYNSLSAQFTSQTAATMKTATTILVAQFKAKSKIVGSLLIWMFFYSFLGSILIIATSLMTWYQSNPAKGTFLYNNITYGITAVIGRCVPFVIEPFLISYQTFHPKYNQLYQLQSKHLSDKHVNKFSIYIFLFRMVSLFTL